MKVLIGHLSAGTVKKHEKPAVYYTEVRSFFGSVTNVYSFELRLKPANVIYLPTLGPLLSSTCPINFN
jgi:hypothetical protein